MRSYCCICRGEVICDGSLQAMINHKKKRVRKYPKHAEITIWQKVREE